MTMLKNPAISVVLPCLNEGLIIDELLKRLTKVLDYHYKNSFEIIFVDDGSDDDSWKKIEKYHQSNDLIKGIKFSRRFGHHIALTAGLRYSKGDLVVMMDSDLQDQPEEIPKLISKLTEGYDVVFGQRIKKQFGFFKIITSKIFMKLMNAIAGEKLLLDSNVFRVMSRRVVDHLNSFNEHERFLMGLISFVGFKQTGVEVEHGARFAGTTKYSFTRLLKLALNLMTSFSYAPLRLAIKIGVGVGFLSLLMAIYIFIRKVVWGFDIAGWASTMLAIFVMGSIQILFLGVIGEYLGRIYTESINRPLYIVEKYL
jgi:glycosyltransferase involved in cell wall biosynthesis